MTKKLHLLALALLSAAILVAGCGGDDDGDKKTDAPAAAQTDTGGDAPADAPADEAEAPALDEETITAIVEAVNQDGSELCDPNNATAEFLESLGGVEECEAAAASEPDGEPYELTDITIEDETATATIEDEDGTSVVTFVVEGDQIKVSSVEDATPAE